MKRTMTVILCVALAACSKEEARQKVVDAKEKVQDVFDVATPVGQKEDAAARERERFDAGWLRLRSFQAAVQRQQERRRAEQAIANLRFVTGVKESFRGLEINAINSAPIAVPISGDVSGPSVLKTQVYLDRMHFSVGVLDGRWGRNSAISLWWYQRTRGIDATGAVDETTFRELAGEAGAIPAVVAHQLTEDDVKGPFVSIPEDIYEKEKLDCLCYESKKEKLAELFHTTEDFLEILNPGVKFQDVRAGETINVPNVRPLMTADQPDLTRIVVSLAGSTLNAFDGAGRLLFHAPTTVGSKYDPSPNETVNVVRTVRDPQFHYQPTLFHEVPDTDPEAQLKPGPNSPVGVVWIALSKPHFGIHGTSDPDSIGYASSHGCVRLANWDAGELSHRIADGIAVEFVDTRHEKND